MIQRKQTIFLLLAIILSVVCLCQPVASLQPVGMGIGSTVFNLWIETGEGARSFTPWPLFAILLISCPVAVAAIATFKNRMLQARLCLLNMFLLLAWMCYFGWLAYSLGKDGAQTFHIHWTAFLVPLAFIMYWLARRGVLADEALVKSMDRIR